MKQMPTGNEPARRDRLGKEAATREPAQRASAIEAAPGPRPKARGPRTGRRRGSEAVLWLAAALHTACSDTGQQSVAVPLFAAGTRVVELSARGDVPVTLERAELAFGPLYLCAATEAGELCETARVEWLGSETLDPTSELATRVGTLEGVSGSVRSWMFDYGITSQLTRDEPFVLDAARALGGHSFRMSGSAVVDAQRVGFELEVTAAPSARVEPGISVVRKSTSDRFSHEVTAEELGLLVRFDPSSWLADVDFRALLEEQRPAEGEPLVIDAESAVAASVRSALVVGERPLFEWGFHP